MERSDHQSKNAVKSGIYSENPLLEQLGESREQRLNMLDQYLHSIQPNNLLELNAVKALFLAEVRMERVSRQETAVTATLLSRTNGDLGEAVLLADNTLHRLSGQGTAALNRYTKAYKLLTDLRSGKMTLQPAEGPIPPSSQILDDLITATTHKSKPQEPEPVENNQSPAEFARAKLNLQPDENQTKALEVQDKNIILNCSRQWGKSTVAAIRIAHFALAVAAATILVVSRTMRQSGELMDKVKKFFEAAGVEPSRDPLNSHSLCLPNKTRILRVPANHETIRGISAVNLLVIDEASLVKNEVYHTILPMLATTNGKIILLSTPWAKSGFFYETWRNGDPEKWFKLAIPATECPRISKEFLASQRKELGERFYKQEYMCEFLDHEFQLFSTELIESCFSDEVKAYPGFEADEDEDIPYTIEQYNRLMQGKKKVE